MGNSNWSPTQLWLIARYIKYCVVKLNLENKLLSAPRQCKTWGSEYLAQLAGIKQPHMDETQTKKYMDWI